MRIAFDLDNTLIPFTSGIQFKVESRTFIRRFFRSEPLRAGTIELLNSLKAEGHEIWIYTSSYRPKNYIRRTFFTHGIKLNGIVTQKTHDAIVKPKNIRFSKHPPSFGIDLLIDDSKGVGMEGVQGNFRTLIIDSENKDWVSEITKVVSENNR